MKIKEAAALCGLTEKAIRLYEAKGLIHPVSEERGGRTFRDYDDACIRELMTVGILRHANFSMEQIGEMQTSPERIPEIFAAYREEIRANAAQLSALAARIEAIDADALADPEKNASGVFFPNGECYGNADRLLREGDEIAFGDEKLTLLHTPGHTRGSSVYLSDGIAFTGDTLMADGNYGRYDLYGGSVTALRNSLRRILTLDGDCRIYPGHGGDTTKEEEKKYYTSII
jgi:DNA-binding transcriptional MerR regulator